MDRKRSISVLWRCKLQPQIGGPEAETGPTTLLPPNVPSAHTVEPTQESAEGRKARRECVVRSKKTRQNSFTTASLFLLIPPPPRLPPHQLCRFHPLVFRLREGLDKDSKQPLASDVCFLTPRCVSLPFDFVSFLFSFRRPLFDSSFCIHFSTISLFDTSRLNLLSTHLYPSTLFHPARSVHRHSKRNLILVSIASSRSQTLLHARTHDTTIDSSTDLISSPRRLLRTERLVVFIPDSIRPNRLSFSNFVPFSDVRTFLPEPTFFQVSRFFLYTFYRHESFGHMNI